VLDLLKDTGKLGYKLTKILIDTNIKLNTKIGESLKDINYFQRFIVKLMVTTPNLSFTVS
jgi:hypothetical protein